MSTLLLGSDWNQWVFLWLDDDFSIEREREFRTGYYSRSWTEDCTIDFSVSLLSSKKKIRVEVLSWVLPSVFVSNTNLWQLLMPLGSKEKCTRRFLFVCRNNPKSVLTFYWIELLSKPPGCTICQKKVFWHLVGTERGGIRRRYMQIRLVFVPKP